MKKKILIAVLSVLCMLSVSVMVLVLCRGGAEESFTPPPFETGAQAGIPEADGYQELDVGVFRVGLCGEVKAAEGMAEVWFANPPDNSVWLRLRILDENGVLLGQTGVLRPGEYIRLLPLQETVPGMAVVLKIMAYEPDTYHSAGALTVHGCIAAE